MAAARPLPLAFTAAILFRGPLTISGLGTWTVLAGGTTDGPGNGANGQNRGGGGGGFGGTGGYGGGSTAVPGGLPYGPLVDTVWPGSGGGGVLGEEGDICVPLGCLAGGGGIQIGATGQLQVNGTIIADGGPGFRYLEKGTGGGSGGGILLTGFDLDINGTVSARGGAGGTGNEAMGFPSGGGGGGGRITLFRNFNGTIDAVGALLDVAGGAKGGISGLQTDGAPGVTAIGSLPFLFSILKVEETLVAGIQLEVDDFDSVTVASSGFASDSVDFGQPETGIGFESGWFVAAGDQIWNDDGDVAAQILPQRLDIFLPTSSSASFGNLTLGASSVLGADLRDELGEGSHAFKSLAFESATGRFYFEGSVTVPEPSPAALAALCVLSALRSDRNFKLRFRSRSASATT